MAGVPSILLVDDDPALLVGMGDFLRTEGYSITTAYSASQAMDRLAAQRPDLVIMDIAMPHTSGLHLLRQLRAHPTLADLPVLIYTCRSELRGFLQDVRVEGFVSKSDPVETLLRELRRILASPLRQAQSGRTLDQTSVLLGEDDPSLAGAIVSVFRDAQFATDVVRSGAEVLEKAIIEKPDAVVVGSVLGNLPTDTILSILARTPGTRRIPVFVYGKPGGAPPRARGGGTDTASPKVVALDNPAELVRAVRDALTPRDQEARNA
jgi:CheY-like chemotaxis protein